MVAAKSILAIFVLLFIFERKVQCDDPSSSDGGGDTSDTSSIPVLVSGKRQHNMMRFGKRPAGGHNLIHFGKREDGSVSPKHSFLYFGKRNTDQLIFPDLLQYLQRNRDNSYKRGHSIMRFGKRSPGSHSFIRFGKREDEGYDNYSPDYDMEDVMEDEKRQGHSMMYFGKRTGHAILSFGKKNDGRKAHSMIHFGKREMEEDEDFPYDDKRAHAMIHFGKKDASDLESEEEKRGSHSMIHFGKRDIDDEPISYFMDPILSDKRQHNLLRFGKKTEGSRKGSHAMMHFGKRDEDEEKRAHTMIHFGKRSVDKHMDSAVVGNQSGKDIPVEGGSTSKTLNRMKREVVASSSPSSPLVTVVGYGPNGEGYEEVPSTDEDLQHAIRMSQATIYNPEDYYVYPEEELGYMTSFSDYKQPYKKDGSKNVFLRFG